MSDLNYYELFGIEASFDIDMDIVRRRYFELMRQCHPDQLLHATDEERRAAAEMSVIVNDAVRTLESPCDRGVYLLRLRGIDQQIPTIGDQEILEEQLRLREELSNISPEDTRQLRAFRDKVEKRRTHLLERISASFAADDLRAAQRSLLELKFWERLLATIPSVTEK